MYQEPITTATLGAAALKAAITRYYKELKNYEGQEVDYELGLRSAFQNLLADVAHMVKWTLVPEQTLEGGIRPDGVMRDEFKLRRGYWEAKGPKGNLDKEIEDKKKKNYPLTNTVFENTKRAILYQNKKKYGEYDLQKPNDVGDLLKQFFAYTEPDIANFEVAVQEFKERIPELAQAVVDIIEREYKQNRKFITAFDSFTDLCRASLDPTISKKAINEMLVQHLLTKRLFRTVFGNSAFIHRNVIAAQIEKVIDALTSNVFNPDDFLKNLDRFYVAIERAAKDTETWSERQDFLNTVYERFFQGFSAKQADTHGIVYTPQEIVDFMCASVEEVLQREFGKSIAEPGVQILDPATGTGNFIVNLIRNHIPRRDLRYKYQHDLFCNEIMLLPYYIASLNIEHEYFAKTNEYEAFEGICFADTLGLAEGQQLSLFVEENTERVQREKDAQIMVVIGNPPYNVGQLNENDNNKNRKYPVIDGRLKETYVKDSKATNRNALSDAYVKFFRWATDRLQGRDGIVCLVTNNSFIDQIAFDGMRKHLQKDFTQIYHLDLHGNVRKNPKLSGTTHNVFSIQVGVGITIAICKKDSDSFLKYYRIPEYWRKTEKLTFLGEMQSISKVDWQKLEPDSTYNWITEGIRPEFTTFLTMGKKDAKTLLNTDAKCLFRRYSIGVLTSRDNWVYDFSHSALIKRISSFINMYNGEVDRWKRSDTPKDADGFVTYDDTKIKWSRDLKNDLKRGRYAQFELSKIRRALYRPFTSKYYFFDSVLSQDIVLQPVFFPTSEAETENIVICVNSVGSDHQTFFAANCIIDYKCGINGNAGAQCFPYYTYSEDGSNRRENITDWALQQFQDKYSSKVTKWDIFHYVYGMLHHPQYRERYAQNLKRDLPHIPLLLRREAFETCVHVGKQLMDIHLNYEQAKEYRLKWVEDEDVPPSTQVEKMRFTPDRTAVIVNESLTLSGIPQECFQYRLGNRSALEWVIDQYQVSKDKRSGIESDPNRIDDPEYIVHLVEKVVTVSVVTVKLVNELAQAVKIEDWLGEKMVETKE